MSRRQGILIGLAVAVLVLVAIVHATSGGSDKSAFRTSPGQSKSPALTTPPPQATGQLDLVAAQLSQGLSSPTVVRGAGTFAAVAYDVHPKVGGIQPHVRIVQYQSGNWHEKADIVLDQGGAVTQKDGGAGTGPVPVDLTGAATPDFLVFVSYNSGQAGAVISAAAGSWRALSFTGGPHPGDEISHPQLNGLSLIEVYNDCKPDCAHGHSHDVAYHYSSSRKAMVASA